MIDRNTIIAWGVNHPWPEIDQIEQDLLLSIAMSEIASDDLLKNELVIRGGTALHKLFTLQPFRYSEDLDYIRTSKGSIGNVMKRLTDIGKNLQFDVSTKMSMYPKVYWKYVSSSGILSRIKIEINTYESFTAFGYIYKDLDIETTYFKRKSKIKTLELEELIASKIRALYQRSKGRDLYDIYLALSNLNIDESKVCKAFDIYKPDNLTKETLITNIENKLNDYQFINDMNNLIRLDVDDYDAIKAGEIVIERLIQKLNI